jgi:hypothetical protein
LEVIEKMGDRGTGSRKSESENGNERIRAAFGGKSLDKTLEWFRRLEGEEKKELTDRRREPRKVLIVRANPLGRTASGAPGWPLLRMSEQSADVNLQSCPISVAVALGHSSMICFQADDVAIGILTGRAAAKSLYTFPLL